jgi:hypothetical protein
MNAFFDISDANGTFSAMMAATDRLSQDMNAKAFGAMMWSSLSEKNRELYRIAFPVDGIGCGFNAEAANAENNILARQERYGFHD